MISVQMMKPNSVEALKAPVINNLSADITATNRIARSRTAKTIMDLPNATE
jgi:hypothetical protein